MKTSIVFVFSVAATLHLLALKRVKLHKSGALGWIVVKFVLLHTKQNLSFYYFQFILFALNVFPSKYYTFDSDVVANKRTIQWNLNFNKRQTK